MIEIHDLPDSQQRSPGISITDLFRYGELLTQVITLWQVAKSLAVGGVANLPTLKVKAFGNRYEWSAGEIKRTA